MESGKRGNAVSIGYRKYMSKGAFIVSRLDPPMYVFSWCEILLQYFVYDFVYFSFRVFLIFCNDLI